MWTHTATFKGRGPFPLDMLRYDCCWPATGDDSAKMAECAYGQPPQEITVKCYAADRRRDFTPARWESFGWRLVGEIKSTKL